MRESSWFYRRLTDVLKADPDLMAWQIAERFGLTEEHALKLIVSLRRNGRLRLRHG